MVSNRFAGRALLRVVKGVANGVERAAVSVDGRATAGAGRRGSWVAALFCSRIEPAKRCGMEPHVHLRDAKSPNSLRVMLIYHPAAAIERLAEDYLLDFAIALRLRR